MGNNTTERPLIQDSDLHDDSVIYRACKPRVRVFEIDVLETIGIILNFRPSSLKIAREIIRRQGGEDVTLSFTDAALAEALFPDLPEEYRLRKSKRGKQNLIEDQSNSNFRFIWKAPRQVEQNESGEYRGLPTKYRPGDYWKVSDELQARSNQKGRELFAVNVHQRRKLEREMLSEILDERGCKKIVRERGEAGKRKPKEKSASGVEAESAGITVSRAMHELQQMERPAQFQFVKEFTETATSHLIADSQDYDEGAHIFSKVQTAALIGGKHGLDDLRQRIARHNNRGRPANPALRAEALRASLDEAAAMILKCEQLAALCEVGDAPECADYWNRWLASLRDFRWAITQERKGRAA